VTTIHKEATYPHPRAKVWRALTEPDLIRKWLMNPEGFAPVVGNEFVLRVDGPHPGWRGFVECKVLAVEPQRLLRYAWVGDPRSAPMTVTFTLSDTGAGTRLVLDHDGFEGFGGWVLARMMMGPGWGKMLAQKIPAVLSSLP
jgi:uncharacterized protein YndB with AHSA1/START domain